MFIEIKGMKNVREEYDTYIKYLIGVHDKLNNETKTMYIRTFNSFVRALSY